MASTPNPENTFTDEQVVILNNHLIQYKAATSRVQKGEVVDLTVLALDPGSNEVDRTTFKKKVQKWFTWKSRLRKAVWSSDLPKAPSFHQLFLQKYQAEITEKLRVDHDMTDNRNSEYLGLRQKVAAEMRKGLNNKQRNELLKAQKDWQMEGPSVEERRK